MNQNQRDALVGSLGLAAFAWAALRRRTPSVRRSERSAEEIVASGFGPRIAFTRVPGRLVCWGGNRLLLGWLTPTGRFRLEDSFTAPCDVAPRRWIAIASDGLHAGFYDPDGRDSAIVRLDPVPRLISVPGSIRRRFVGFSHDGKVSYWIEGESTGRWLASERDLTEGTTLRSAWLTPFPGGRLLEARKVSGDLSADCLLALPDGRAACVRYCLATGLVKRELRAFDTERRGPFRDLLPDGKTAVTLDSTGVALSDPEGGVRIVVAGDFQAVALSADGGWVGTLDRDFAFWRIPMRLRTTSNRSVDAVRTSRYHGSR